MHVPAGPADAFVIRAGRENLTRSAARLRADDRTAGALVQRVRVETEAIIPAVEPVHSGALPRVRPTSSEVAGSLARRVRVDARWA